MMHRICVRSDSLTEKALSTLLPQLWPVMVHAVSAVSTSSLVVLTQNSDLLLKVSPQQIGYNVVFVFFHWFFKFLMPEVLLKLITLRLWFVVPNLLNLFQIQLFYADPRLVFFLLSVRLSRTADIADIPTLFSAFSPLHLQQQERSFLPPVWRQKVAE